MSVARVFHKGLSYSTVLTWNKNGLQFRLKGTKRLIAVKQFARKSGTVPATPTRDYVSVVEDFLASYRIRLHSI